MVVVESIMGDFKLIKNNLSFLALRYLYFSPLTSTHLTLFHICSLIFHDEHLGRNIETHGPRISCDVALLRAAHSVFI